MLGKVSVLRKLDKVSTPEFTDVHERAQLVVAVKCGICGLAKAHPVTLALLIVFAVVGDERGAVLVGWQALFAVRVKHEITGGGAGALPRAHAANCEGAGDQHVAELHWPGISACSEAGRLPCHG